VPRNPKSDQESSLDPETAQLVESIHAKLEQLDLFTLLDIDLNADADRVRRGYFTRSRLFHPDRHFTKDLGAHKKMLERIFAWTTAAYDFLKDDKRRAAYRRLILTARDRRSCARGEGARVVAVESGSGMAFKIVDEEAFYAGDAAEQPVLSGGGEVRLPQNKYAIPRVQRGPTEQAGAKRDEGLDDLLRDYLKEKE
jgi:DnaJ-class molecular chaperone